MKFRKPRPSIAACIGRTIVHSAPKKPAESPEKKTVAASAHSSPVIRTTSRWWASSYVPSDAQSNERSQRWSSRLTGDAPNLLDVHVPSRSVVVFSKLVDPRNDLGLHGDPRGVPEAARRASFAYRGQRRPRRRSI
jgi:hypothetical protein